MPVLVVRRDLHSSYYFFTEITMKSNDVDFIVDRRIRERRHGLLLAQIETRAGDRREEPPRTWTREGFLIR